MGEKETAPFQFTFNGFLKVAFQGSRVTSDAGLMLVRELDERLGLDAIITEHLRDSRQGLNTQFRLPDLLRQSVYSRLAGYEDLNDAVRLAADPTFRLIGSPKRWDRSAALTSGEPSDPTPVRGDAPADLGATRCRQVDARRVPGRRLGHTTTQVRSGVEGTP